MNDAGDKAGTTPERQPIADPHKSSVEEFRRQLRTGYPLGAEEVESIFAPDAEELSPDEPPPPDTRRHP